MNQESANVTNRTSAGLFLPSLKANNRGVVIITGKPKITSDAEDGMSSNQGTATLIVMCCVLTIIMLYCCLSAPGIRDLCKKYVFRQCVIDDPDVNNVWNRRQMMETQHKLVSEKQQRRSSRNSEHRQSRRASSHPRPH